MPPSDKKLYLAGASKANRPEPAAGRSGKPAKDTIDPRDLGAIRRDDLGNAVWQWHPKVPGRRDEDPTIDFLEALEVDGLSLEDDADSEDPADSKVFNPYDKER